MWICVESKEASTAAQWRNDLQQIVDGEDSLKDVLCVADPGGPGIETLNLCAVVVHQDFMHTTAEERSTSCLSIKTHLTSHGQWIIMVVNKTIQRRIARPHRWKELKKRIGFGKRIDTLPIRPRPVVEKALLTSPRRGSLSPFKISQSPKPVAHFQPWEGGGVRHSVHSGQKIAQTQWILGIGQAREKVFFSVALVPICSSLSYGSRSSKMPPIAFWQRSWGTLFHQKEDCGTHHITHIPTLFCVRSTLVIMISTQLTLPLKPGNNVTCSEHAIVGKLSALQWVAWIAVGFLFHTYVLKRRALSFLQNRESFSCGKKKYHIPHTTYHTIKYHKNHINHM